MNSNENKRGRFIVFEGTDGCGKTTHTNLICEYLKEKTGKRVLYEREPDSRDIIGAIIRSALYGNVKISADAMAYLHVADRLEHVEYMLPLLEAGNDIICDRYYISTMAYNTTPNLSVEQLYDLNRPVAEKLQPDLIVFLDVDPVITARRRAAERSDEEIYDAMEKQVKIRENYHKALEVVKKAGVNVVVIDASKTIAEVQEDIRKAIDAIQ